MKRSTADETQAARVTLAEAIDALGEARRRREETRASIYRAEGLVTAAEAKLEEARARVVLAREANVNRVETEIHGGDVLEANLTLRDVRQAEAEARDDVDAAQAALERLRIENAPVQTVWLNRSATPVDATFVAERAVEARVDDVVRAVAFDQFVTDTATMQRALVGRRLILCDLLRSDLVGESTDKESLHKLMMDFELPQRAYGSSFKCSEEHILADPEARKWREFRAALALDAKTPLPEVGS